MPLCLAAQIASAWLSHWSERHNALHLCALSSSLNLTHKPRQDPTTKAVLYVVVSMIPSTTLRAAKSSWYQLATPPSAKAGNSLVFRKFVCLELGVAWTPATRKATND